MPPTLMSCASVLFAMGRTKQYISNQWQGCNYCSSQLSRAHSYQYPQSLIGGYEYQYIKMAMATISSPMNRLSIASSPLNGSLTSPKNKLVLLSSVNTTLRQVDYDEDVTSLYEAIGNSEWDKATSLINAKDAATWVVRYERDAQGNKLAPFKIQWRFLPIHSSCALNPPASFLRKLLNAYSDGPRTLDDQGLLPLHYACGARCSRETVYSLLMNFPHAALREDPNGMLPIHYLAQWGPDSKQGQMNMGVLDMLLVSTGDKAANCDRDGNTAERLAMNAEYDGHLDVAKHIASFLHRKGLGNGVDPASSGKSISSTVEVIKSPKYKNNRPVLKINVNSPSGSQFNFHSFDDAVADEDTVIEHAPEGNIEASLSMSARENTNQNHTPRSSSGVQKQPPPSPYTPKSGRNRSFSWGDQGQNNENSNARDSFSVSGSTWTTHISSPPKSAPHANRHMRQQTAGFPPMSPRQNGFPPMSPRQNGRVPTPKAKARPQQQLESRQDDESERWSQSFQSGSTNNSNSTSYSSILTQQLVELAEMERREGLESPLGNIRSESPLGNSGFVPNTSVKSASETLLLEEIARLKAEKERAEANLAKAKGAHSGEMMGSIMGLSELSPIGEDEMSRLTEHDLEGEKVPLVADSIEEVGNDKISPPAPVLSTPLPLVADSIEEAGNAKISPPAPVLSMPPVASEIERLEKEREMIELQLKKAREGPKEPEEAMPQGEVKDAYKALFEEEQNEHTSTKNMLQEERRKRGEDLKSHLDEVKSLRVSLETATKEIAKYQSLQSKMDEMKRKELEWDVARERLEAEIKHLKESAAQNHGVSDSSVTSSLTNNSGSSMLKLQYESSVKEANDLRKFSADLRKEHNETIAELENELENERTEKIKIMSNVVSLEYRISTLEDELEAAQSVKAADKFDSEHVAALEANLERESSKNYQLQHHVSTLEKELEEAMARKKHGGDIDRMAFELHQLKRRLSDKLEEAEKSKERLDAAKSEFERKEKDLLEQLDDAKEELVMAKKQHQDNGDIEESYLQKIRNLKTRIRDLEEADDDRLAMLRGAEKIKERTIEEQEDKYLEKIRQLKKEYEEKLEDKEDSYCKEMRELKKKQENELREKEESYIKDLREAKKRERELQNREASYTVSDADINRMIEEKENAFKERVATLTAEIDALRQESNFANDGDIFEAELLECKSEMKSQGRKHRSEMNKLKNTLEMQKSKEARLEGHIKNLEKQIIDMTADYEARIQEYLYSRMDTK